MDALTESKYVPGSPIYTAVYIQERPGTLSRGEQPASKGGRQRLTHLVQQLRLVSARGDAPPFGTVAHRPL